MVVTRRPGSGAPAACTRFLIFGQGRTGSTLLASLLSSHPKVQCDGEILETATIDPFGHVAMCQAASTKPVHGFKVKIYQLTDAQHIAPALFLNAMSNMGTRIIFLSRRNVLRQVLSNRLALANRYHFRRGDTVKLEPVRLEPTELVAAIARRAEHQRDEEAAIRDLVVHRVVYEDDLMTPEAQRRSLGSCFDYLGLPPAPIFTDLLRGGVGPVSSYIVNYSGVAAVLTGTAYEHLLADPAYD